MCVLFDFANAHLAQVYIHGNMKKLFKMNLCSTLFQEDTIRSRSGICSTGGTMWSGSWGGDTSPLYGYAGTYSESHTHTHKQRESSSSTLDLLRHTPDTSWTHLYLLVDATMMVTATNTTLCWHQRRPFVLSCYFRVAMAMRHDKQRSVTFQ